MPHAGPASWKRAADKLAKAASDTLPKVRGGVGTCLKIVAKVSFFLDPVSAIAGPTTTMGDATIQGHIRRRVEDLQNINDPTTYWGELQKLKNDWSGSEWLKHLEPLADKQLQILEQWNNERNNYEPQPLF